MDKSKIYTIEKDGTVTILNVSEFMKLFDIELYQPYNSYFEKCVAVAAVAKTAANNAHTFSEYRNLGKYKKQLNRMADRYYKLKWDCLGELGEKIEDPDFYDAAEALFIGSDILLNSLTRAYGIEWN